HLDSLPFVRRTWELARRRAGRRRGGGRRGPRRDVRRLPAGARAVDPQPGRLPGPRASALRPVRRRLPAPARTPPPRPPRAVPRPRRRRDPRAPHADAPTAGRDHCLLPRRADDPPRSAGTAAPDRRETPATGQRDPGAAPPATAAPVPDFRAQLGAGLGAQVL